MPNPKPSADFRNIGVMARGAVLRAIDARSKTDQVSLGRAALSLIEQAIAAEPIPAETLINLETVSMDDLIDELVGRLKRVDEIDAVTARAEIAEAKLLTIASALSGNATA